MNVIKPVYLCLFVCLLFQGGCQSSSGPDLPNEVSTIVFASCARPNQGQQVWQSILRERPDLFLFIGDNVYVDIPRPPKGVEDFQRTYDTFETNQPGWQELRKTVPVFATWDDHDYGLNDAGKEFPLKAIAQQQFIKFFDLPSDSPVRQRPGVYDAHLFGSQGQRVQIIMLDTRMFRDALKRNPKGRVNGLGPYIPHSDGKGTLLGETQWAWLETQLSKPAEFRVIASSIQVVNSESGWECWGNFPHERDRLYNLIKQTKANGVVFLSGDRHLTEISVQTDGKAPYPLCDFTSSSMDEKGWKKINEPNRYRQQSALRTANYGLLQVDWDGPAGPALTFQSRNRNGSTMLSKKVLLKDLQVSGQ